MHANKNVYICAYNQRHLCYVNGTWRWYTPLLKQGAIGWWVARATLDGTSTGLKDLERWVQLYITYIYNL